MGKKTEKKSATINSSDRMKKGPVEDGEIHNMKPRDVSKNALEWEKSNLIIKATSKIFTKTTFPNLGLHPYLAELLQSPSDSIKKGFGLPSCTTIQAKSVPLNLNSQRNNVLMKSQTGSGKTLAYLIPVINDLMQLSPTVKREDGTRALIIAPTRELCNQISDVVGKLTQCCVNLVSGCISGGEKKKSEKARLRKGVVVLVSTPGRLLDHIKLTESFDLTNLRWIVMDEVDRLLDMGFEQTILEILSRIKGERLPGLKENHVIPSTDGSNGGSGGSGGGGKHNLVGKWSQQNLVLSKKVSHPEELRYLVASATLSKAVKQLVWPIMRSFNPSIGFAVVDGDQGSISTIRAENDLYEMRPDQQHAGGVVVFDDDDNEEGNKDGENEGKELTNALLDEDEKVDAPTRLAQYSMIIPCKWRLTALLSFLYLRRHQKVIVFFSTCDEVDYHALLFHQLKWPTAFNSQTFTPQQSSGGKDDEKNKGFTFTSFDEVNWQEHMKTVSEFDSSEPPQPQGGGGRRKPTSASSSSASSSSASANNATIDPLNWKFTGVFGKDCPMFRLHGKVPQSIRKLVYKEFAKASKGILFCTDVAARGLDLPKVDYILQYDPPCETSDYIHRIGRTARCGLAGSALLFLLPSEQIYLNLLSSHGLLLSSLSLQSMFSEISKEIPNFNEKKWKNYEEIASVILQKNIEDCIYSNKYLIQASIQAYHSYLRAYTTHSKDSKSIFRLNVLHLGHVAKSFGLKETPKEFKQQHQSSIIHDVIGKIFNGEFASKQFKQSLLPAKKKESTTSDKTVTKTNDKEEEESEEEIGDDEDNDSEENDDIKEEMEVDDDQEEEGEHASNNAFSDEEDDDEEDEDEELQAVKTKKDKNKKSTATSNDDVVYALGKRKLSFGSNQSAANKKKRLMVASGKFRSAGSYFRKKLRKQSITEFSAN